MHFDTALNAVWLVLGIVALGSTVRSRIHITRSRVAGEESHATPAWLHVCGVALIVAALFPYISATDDFLRIQYLNVQHGQQNPVKPGSDTNLMRLYEAMDTPVVSQVQQIAFVLFFVFLVAVRVFAVTSRSTPLQSGRSPPLLVDL